VSILTDIKTAIARRRLKKDAKRMLRNRAFVNFDDAGSIGILYQLDNEETYRQVAAYVSSLQAQRKNVKIIGLFYGDLQPLYYIPKLSFDLLMSKDVNWYGRPKAEFVTSFLAEEFDLLFYFSDGVHTPLDYIYGLSGAKLKVSNDNDKISNYSDLVIATDIEDGIAGFLRTSIHYLSVINKKDDA
jgi:hypothetical protein